MDDHLPDFICVVKRHAFDHCVLSNDNNQLIDGCRIVVWNDKVFHFLHPQQVVNIPASGK